MEDRVIIVIDDNDETKTVEEKVVQQLKKEGIKVKPIVINPSTRELSSDDSDIDLSKVLNKIRTEISGHHIDVIACDYELSDDTVTGLTIIDKLRNELRKKCPVLLYSGKVDKVVRDIFDNQVANDADKRKKLEKLIRCNITTFVDRPNYPNEIIRNLKKVDIASVLVRKLREYGSKKIISIETFNSHTLNQLAEKIEAGQADEKLIAEIIELTLAHYISIDENIGEDHTSG